MTDRFRAGAHHLDRTERHAAGTGVVEFKPEICGLEMVRSNNQRFVWSRDKDYRSEPNPIHNGKDESQKS